MLLNITKNQHVVVLIPMLIPKINNTEKPFYDNQLRSTSEHQWRFGPKSMATTKQTCLFCYKKLSCITDVFKRINGWVMMIGLNGYIFISIVKNLMVCSLWLNVEFELCVGYYNGGYYVGYK